MSYRRFLPLLPAPFLLALGAWMSARVADRAGAMAAVALDSVALLARAPVRPAEPALGEALPTDLIAEEPLIVVEAPVAAPLVKGKKGAKKPAVSAAPVLFVSRERVLGLANSGARPRGVPVPANGPRPAGLKLMGVAAFGVGLVDGDVLTRALGVPALSSGAVIQAVLMARSRRTPVLEGEFWRGNQRRIIRVEQPYLPERHASDDIEDENRPRLTMQLAGPRLAHP